VILSCAGWRAAAGCQPQAAWSGGLFPGHPWRTGHQDCSSTARNAACADDWSGSSRSIWSQRLSALGAFEVVERCRRETVVLSDRW